MITMDAAKILEERQKILDREVDIFATFDPTLPTLTRIIMAQDYRQAEDALAEVRTGNLDPKRALAYAGSYSRIQLLVDLMNEGFITSDDVLDMLPDLWPGSDPDDTDERFIALWRQAFHRNGGRPVLDRDQNKLPRKRTLTVWRGQRPGDKLGCAWSLSKETAEKFARGASFRVPMPMGELIELTVERNIILAYLTGRGEDEVIIDPATVERTSR